MAKSTYQLVALCIFFPSIFLTSVISNSAENRSPRAPVDASHFTIYVTNEKSGDLSEIDSSTLR
jgi:hypothetical protein